MQKIIYEYNLLPAALCAVITIAVYIPIRAVWLKVRRKRGSFPSELARALIAGYIAALINIVWYPLPDLVQCLLSDPARLERDFSGGYYAKNYEVIRLISEYGLRGIRIMARDFEMIANIALFVPLGSLLPFAFPKLKWWQVDLICLGTTCVVELIQPFFGRACDLDDIVMNALGGVIGCALAKTALAVFVRKREVSYEEK